MERTDRKRILGPGPEPIAVSPALSAGSSSISDDLDVTTTTGPGERDPSPDHGFGGQSRPGNGLSPLPSPDSRSCGAPSYWKDLLPGCVPLPFPVSTSVHGLNAAVAIVIAPKITLCLEKNTGSADD